LLEADIKDNLTEDTSQYLEYIKESSHSLRGYIDGILGFYKADDLLKRDDETILVNELMDDLKHLYRGDINTVIHLNTDVTELHTNKAALMQIFVNLVSNAVKYNDKARTVVEIAISRDDDHYNFTVSDNGPGIPEEHRDQVFDLFETIQKKDKHGQEGTGIGLATVKKVVHSLGGEVSISSEMGKGTQLNFTIAAT
jgi:signal transduction histidine kinase